MELVNYLIVGSGVAGSTAALTLRRLDTHARIMLVGQEPEPMYARTQLAAYVRGFADKEALLLRHPSHFSAQGIELVNARAEEVDITEHSVRLSSNKILRYEKLLLAGGSKPRRWNLSPLSMDGIFSLHSLADADAMRERLKKARHVVVIGGGFVTLNMIEALAEIGVATTVVDRGPRYWADVLDEESSQLLERKINSVANVHTRFGTAVEHIEGKNSVAGVLLSDGRRLPCDMIIANIGTEPDVDWLRSSGLVIDGGVAVDAFLQSSDDSVWAAGDIATFEDVMLGVRHRLGNWTNAAAQGEAAAFNMSSNLPKPYRAISAYSITFMGLHVDFIADFHVHSGMIAVPRGSARSGHYGRLMVHEQRLVGATLLNYFADKPAIEKIISSRTILQQSDILAFTDETIPLRQTADRLVRSHR